MCSNEICIWSQGDYITTEFFFFFRFFFFISTFYNVVKTVQHIGSSKNDQTKCLRFGMQTAFEESQAAEGVQRSFKYKDAK